MTFLGVEEATGSPNNGGRLLEAYSIQNHRVLIEKTENLSFNWREFGF